MENKQPIRKKHPQICCPLPFFVWPFYERILPLSSRSEVTKSGLSCGLLVDWLERLDPEVTTVCPDLQQKLLFALNKVI